ncbi:MAG: NADH-quinone oxidoreductase subunit N [Candidatus Poribacteria bacterium]
MSIQDFIFVLPEIFLALTICFILVAEITYHGEKIRLVSATALVGLGTALLQSVIVMMKGPARVFSGSMAIDGLTFFFRILFIGLGAITIISSVTSKEINPTMRAEYTVLLVASCLGMCVSASATDVVLGFLALQLSIMSGYFLAGYSKWHPPGNEAAIKIMIGNVTAAAFLAYGLAMIFASTGQLNMQDIHISLMSSGLSQKETLMTFVFILFAICFPLGIFPFHFWSPDVAEGAPTPVSSFLSVGIKSAALALGLRLIMALFAQPALTLGQWQILGQLEWPRILAVISSVSMLYGALLAFRQQSAKRLMGYLLVSQTGALLMGMLVLDDRGITAILFNLLVELIAVTGVFYVLSVFYDEAKTDNLEKLKLITKRAIPETIALIFFVMCIVGLPPTPGFFGKFALFEIALRYGWSLLLIVAILSMTISVIAASRLIYNMVGGLGAVYSERALVVDSWRRVFIYVLLAPLVVAAVFVQPIFEWLGKSIKFILW